VDVCGCYSPFISVFLVKPLDAHDLIFIHRFTVSSSPLFSPPFFFQAALAYDGDPQGLDHVIAKAHAQLSDDFGPDGAAGGDGRCAVM
jgi:hypothetical protein